ncbi:class F sortase [Amycolatopsis sp. QT-25]|uniref:class F sortase n=1 Tax=Amycolatopsis sp. QT-25 TaxID=3034022 RepID=UPI0023EDED0A|nr:class F sortase [Amycolatopsis sp. QT-25]WET81540.1 class F sortase [Amycolatopsis sp. QT-25]
MRPWLAELSAVVCALAISAGVIVLTWIPPEQAVSLAEPMVMPGEDGAPLALPADSSTRGQRPGTVRLPEGGSARLVRSEVNSDGVLPIPRGLGDAAWWGARLGAEAGTSLISGHVNWGGTKGPFDELWRMREGQEVAVSDAAGGIWVYRVREVVTMHKNDLPTQAAKLFTQRGPHRLVLVTCGGDYLGGTDGYRDNRIVVATPVSGPPA